MAVTFTLEQWAGAVRYATPEGGRTADQIARLTARFEMIKGMVESRAPDAPPAVQNGCTILLGEFLMYPAGSNALGAGDYSPRYLAGAWYSSGCAAVTKQWAKRRATIPNA